MTRSGIGPWPFGPLANTLPNRSIMAEQVLKLKNIMNNNSKVT